MIIWCVIIYLIVIVLYEINYFFCDILISFFYFLEKNTTFAQVILTS